MNNTSHRHCDPGLEPGEAIQKSIKKTGLPRRPYGLLAMTLITCLTLTACVDRKAADERLASGCASGVEIYLTGGFKIKEIKDKKFAPSTEEGAGYREVTLSYVESDGWANIDKEARCIFAEEFGLFGMGYGANIYQIRVNDQVYGKQGDKLLGSYEDMMKLTNAVDNAMNR
jgi:hypothetical protein